MAITLLVTVLPIIGGTKIRIRTEDASAAPGAPVIFNLWADYKIYECTIEAQSRNEWYECDSSNILTEIGTTCTEELKLLLTGTKSDAPVFDRITLTTNTGNWYGINGLCHPNSEPLGTINRSYRRNNNVCDHYGDYSQVQTFCIDTDGVDLNLSCFPAKQIIYFDINRPNQTIDDAEWRNGEQISTDSLTCDPTKNPTGPPTTQPTLEPTNEPTLEPTNLPSFNPTNPPNVNPSKFPSNRPTLNPSNINKDGEIIATVTAVLSKDKVSENDKISVALIASIVIVPLLIFVFIVWHVVYKKKQTNTTLHLNKRKDLVTEMATNLAIVAENTNKLDVKDDSDDNSDNAMSKVPFSFSSDMYTDQPLNASDGMTKYSEEGQNKVQSLSSLNAQTDLMTVMADLAIVRYAIVAENTNRLDDKDGSDDNSDMYMDQPNGNLNSSNGMTRNFEEEADNNEDMYSVNPSPGSKTTAETKTTHAVTGGAQI